MKIKTILCATDFSEHSLAAVESAAELAARFEAELLLLHVIPFGFGVEGGYRVANNTEHYLRKKVELQLQQLQAEKAARCTQVRHLVRIGDAETEIMAAAAAESVDLLVIGSHGSSGWRSVVFGSVTEAVLRASRGPVLTVRPAKLPTGAVSNHLPVTGIKSIVCPTDFSPPSTSALECAVAWAQEFGARLYVLHVLGPEAPALGVLAPREYEDSRIKDADRQVRAYLEEHLPPGMEASVHIRIGDIDDEILHEADKVSADLIVIATHGQSGWKHLVFGSVMEAVVRQSTRPVLTVHEAAPVVPVGVSPVV